MAQRRSATTLATSNDQFGHVADERSGAWSAIVGIAANASLKTRLPVELTDLASDLPMPDYVPEPFGPVAIWRNFDPARYHFLEGARTI
jgi:hypothetical protein